MSSIKRLNDQRWILLKVGKSLTINIGQYQALRISVEDVATYDEANAVLIDEINRLKIPVNKRIRQCLEWNEGQTGMDAWM